MHNQSSILNIIGTCGLAPMAGYTDSSFRRICRSYGATFTVTEMISAKAIRYGDRKTEQLMHFQEDERPIGIQLFGADPDDFAYASEYAVRRFHPDFIDINMGCPAPKITGGGAGSKLMDSPALAAEIVKKTVSACGIPVTVKMRAGFKTVTAPALSAVLEESGASALFVHARTRDQMYHPPIDPSVIRQVKQTVSIPVFGNGDLLSSCDIDQMLRETGCDGVMIGRGALGNPYIFARDSGLSPSLEDRCAVLLRHARASVEEKGPYVGIREMRKHAPYYFKNVNHAAQIRGSCVQIETLGDLEKICEEALSYGYAR